MLSINGLQRFNDTAVVLFAEPTDGRRSLRIINGKARLRTEFHGDLPLCAATSTCASFTVDPAHVEALTKKADDALIAAGFGVPTGRMLGECPADRDVENGSGDGVDEGSGGDPPLIQVTVGDVTELEIALKNATVEKIVIAAKTYVLKEPLEIKRGVILEASEPGLVVLARDVQYGTPRRVIFIDVPANVSVELIGLNITRGLVSARYFILIHCAVLDVFFPTALMELAHMELTVCVCALCDAATSLIFLAGRHACSPLCPRSIAPLN